MKRNLSPAKYSAHSVFQPCLKARKTLDTVTLIKQRIPTLEYATVPYAGRTKTGGSASTLVPATLMNVLPNGGSDYPVPGPPDCDKLEN